MLKLGLSIDEDAVDEDTDVPALEEAENDAESKMEECSDIGLNATGLKSLLIYKVQVTADWQIVLESHMSFCGTLETVGDKNSKSFKC
ncbi:hypothetical protein Tco_1281186 [Tanacetum coccineum]